MIMVVSVANQDLEVLVLFCCFHCAGISPLLLTGFKCLSVEHVLGLQAQHHL